MWATCGGTPREPPRARKAGTVPLQADPGPAEKCCLKLEIGQAQEVPKAAAAWSSAPVPVPARAQVPQVVAPHFQPQASQFEHGPLPLRLEAEPIVRESLGSASKSPSDAELSDLRLLPSNVMRSLPYTAYIAVGSYAVICWSRAAALLEVCLLTNEILNAARWLRRPRGAADSGIYPQHFPKLSTSNGMPSGHAQTSTLLATIFTCYVLDLQPQADPEA
eukprot:s2004_g2.t1